MQGQIRRRPMGYHPQYYPQGYSVHQMNPQQQQFFSSNNTAGPSTQPPVRSTGESRAQKQVGANFLPSIVNEAYHNVLEQVVTAMCYKAGFDDIEEGALETLMLIFHSSIKRIGEQSRLACEIAGRTIVTPGDVWFGLINMGFRVKTLADFHQDQLGSALTVHAPEITPPDAKTQALRIGTPRPHPNYVYDWLPPFPDPHTYIKTEISEEADFSYEKVREAMAQKKRNGVTSLVNYMVRTYPTICLYREFEQIIHEQVKETFKKESEEKRMQEAFTAFRDLLGTKEIEEVKNVPQKLFDKGLINEHELQTGTEVVVMCSDGALIDQQGERVYLNDATEINLEDRDRISESKNRMVTCGDGAESLRYHWPTDVMLDELIELDSCTMDLGDERPDELKYMQEKITFEYLPEWCHILIPTAREGLSYLKVVSDDLKAEEESRKEKKDKEGVNNEEEKKVKEEESFQAHRNLYLCPPICDDSDYEEEVMETEDSKAPPTDAPPPKEEMEE
ncbi:unnamed protein product [Caenorhabditis brenneri]